MPYLDEMVGWQTTDTSYNAALKQVGKVDRIRAQVFICVKDHGPLTCSAAGKILHKRHRSIQPRFTELKELGLIRDSGLRGLSDMGEPAIMWEVVNPEGFGE